jgi:hypothetical protein
MSGKPREAAADCFTAQPSYLLEPEVPSGSGPDMENARRAHALEYIAAQLGHINAKLDKIVTTIPAAEIKD